MWIPLVALLTDPKKGTEARRLKKGMHKYMVRASTFRSSGIVCCIRVTFPWIGEPRTEKPSAWVLPVRWLSVFRVVSGWVVGVPRLDLVCGVGTYAEIYVGFT